MQLTQLKFLENGIPKSCHPSHGSIYFTTQEYAQLFPIKKNMLPEKMSVVFLVIRPDV